MENRFEPGSTVMTGLIIVVNYDQEREIRAFLQRLAAVRHGLDVLVVDDGSKDGSPEIAEKMGHRVVHHPVNRGVGAAIRTGIRWALERSSYDFVVIMSANGKMRPEDIAAVTAPILKNGADYVQGSRFSERGRSIALSLFRSAAIPAYSRLASTILGRRFTDITCGFRAYRLWLCRDPRVNLDQPWLDRYEAELYIHYYACRLGAKIVEVPVTIDYSHLIVGRKTKMRPFVGWWSILRPFFLLATGVKR